MRAPRSLQARLALAIGLGVTLLWIAAATVTATMLRHDMEEVFDWALAGDGATDPAARGPRNLRPQGRRQRPPDRDAAAA